MPTGRRSAGKTKATAAWAAWTIDDSESAATEFLQTTASWAEGTAAQLLRQHWPYGTNRPTTTEVQERLYHYLSVAARNDVATYLEALEFSRGKVIAELTKLRARLT